MLIAQLMNVQFDPNQWWSHFFQFLATAVTIGVPAFFLWMGQRRLGRKVDEQTKQGDVRTQQCDNLEASVKAVGKKVGVTNEELAEERTAVAVRKATTDPSGAVPVVTAPVVVIDKKP